jgi:hypothetical protein
LLAPKSYPAALDPCWVIQRNRARLDSPDVDHPRTA